MELDIGEEWTLGDIEYADNPRMMASSLSAADRLLNCLIKVLNL